MKLIVKAGSAEKLALWRDAFAQLAPEIEIIDWDAPRHWSFVPAAQFVCTRFGTRGPQSEPNRRSRTTNVRLSTKTDSFLPLLRAF